MLTLERTAVKCKKRKKGREMRKKRREILRYTLFIFRDCFRVFCDKCIAGHKIYMALCGASLKVCLPNATCTKNDTLQIRL